MIERYIGSGVQLARIKVLSGLAPMEQIMTFLTCNNEEMPRSVHE